MIPQVFEDRMRSLLGQQANVFLQSLRDEPVRGIRFHPDKPAPHPAGTGPEVSWYPGMHYLSLDSEAGKLPLHEAGAYYLQEPSASAPPKILDPMPGELVLDLCAAPGGKTTALAMLAPQATIVANEIVPDRARILSANVERMGCANTVVVNESPDRLSRQWPCVFDAVLVDAPCSGEGMFRRHPESISEWTPDSPAACAARQKSILEAAARMVRPGGRLCYSTCTFNRLENEDRIEAFLGQHPDFEPADFSLNGVGTAKDGCLRLWPHLQACEGHFVALLIRKDDESRSSGSIPLAGYPMIERAARKEAESILLELLKDEARPDVEVFDGFWQLPDRTPDLRGLHVLRPGLRLLRRQQRLLLPDHALSHAIEARQKLDISEEQASRYLHGETLEIPADLSGWCEVCLHGVALGWGKQTQSILKNHYPKGLRK